jgi:hypothetical protein
MTWYDPRTWELFGTTETVRGIDLLRDELLKRQRSLSFTAVFDEPTFSGKTEPTAVFPYTVYTDDEVYCSGVKEFPIPDDGLNEQTAPLVQFLAQYHDKDVGDVTFDDVVAIAGVTADAWLASDGDIRVGSPKDVGGDEDEGDDE